MSQRLILPLLAAAILMCGCTADTTPSATNASKESVSTTESTTVASVPAAAETPGIATTESANTETATSAGDADELNNEPPKELVTSEDYLEAIQAQLGSSGGNPSEESIAAAITLGEQGLAKLPENRMMLNVFAGLLYQTLPFASDEIANSRRFKLGELARKIAKGSEPADATTAQVLLLEEAKAHIAGNDLKTAWESVTEARALGFDQTEYLFFDPAFESLVNNDQVAMEIKDWLAGSIDEEFAASEAFPFDFTLKSFSGEEVSLADYKGKPLIVDFWGTWCPPCRKAIPHLVEIFEEQNDKIAVVGINLENPQGDIPFEEAKAKLDQFVETQPINYPCLHGNPEIVAGIPGFEGFPTMLFIDGTGTVRLKLTGYHPKQKLEVIVEKLLTEQPKAGA